MNKPLSERPMERVEDRYVQTKRPTENHPFETHAQKRPKRPQKPRKGKDFFNEAKDRFQSKQNDRIRTKLRETPLTRTETKWWNKTLVLKSFIKRDLQDFRVISKHHTLKKLYELILKQTKYRNMDYRALYDHIAREYKALFSNRLRR